MHSIEFLGEIGVVLVAALLGELVARALHPPLTLSVLLLAPSCFAEACTCWQ